MNPDDLRSRLAAAYPDHSPPPDLAARAERAARGLRRRRAAAVVVAAAVAVAIPLSAAALGRPERALPPAGGGPADSACAWNRDVLPRQPRALTRADVDAWGYRGDPALRTTAAQVGRDASGVPVAVPLWAGRVDGTVVLVYAAQIAPGLGEWQVVATTQEGGSSATGRLPRADAGSAVSLLLRWPTAASPSALSYAGNLLVALAPPGSSAVVYRGCREGTAFTVDGRGDVLVRPVGTLDAEGRLAVRTASGGVGYNGPAADMPFPLPRASVLTPPVAEIPLPDGTREVFRAEGQGPVTQSQGVSADRATIYVRCRAPETLDVTVDRRLVGAARCDGSVELVAEDIPVTGRPGLGPADEPPPPISYRLLIVTDP